MQQLIDKIFSVNDSSFESIALEVFNYQYNAVEIYRAFCQSVKRTPEHVKSISDIPFLPIEFFKTHKVMADGKKEEAIFESSGTTGSVPSKHFVADLGLYENSFTRAFELFYGSPGRYAVLALLPSYLERGNSSLVYMADKLIKLSGHKDSGFFLSDFEQLQQVLKRLKGAGQPTILLGVTFALLDFAEQFGLEFPGLIIMETGGMKGRREELTRNEVHDILKPAFGVQEIHSEYGMTELLSQAYSKGKGIFECPPWMRVYTRDIYDPLSFSAANRSGGANVVDLANLYSCSFIATGDIVLLNSDGTFNIAGRLDNAEVRGCNLMVV